MRNSFKFWIFSILAVWIVVIGIVWINKSLSPSPQSIRNLTDRFQEISDTGESEKRTALIHQITAQLNHLTFQQRQELQKSPEMDHFYASLTESERAVFLEQTLPTGFQHMMERLNQLSSEERQKIVDRAIRDLNKNALPTDEPIDPDSPEAKMIIEQGMAAFYRDASTETKLDFAPVIEQMQRNLQKAH